MDNIAVTWNLQNVFNFLLAYYGHQRWWPAEEPFEVMVGAVLTQSAAWTNVEKAIRSLKAANALNPAFLLRLTLPELASLIYSCGYYNSKARKLRALAEWFSDSCLSDISRMRGMKTDDLRRELLAVWGIGEETADSIILYAAEQPIFVIDTYTRRIIERLGLSPEKKTYAGFQALFMYGLPQEVTLYNEFHALLVQHGKSFCRKEPRCNGCCLREMCQYTASRD